MELERVTNVQPWPLIDKLAKALAKAQGEMPAVKMDAVNPFFKSKYASLGSVINTAKPILKKHGLSVVQFPVSQYDGQIGVHTMLVHESGQYLEDIIFVGMPENAKNPAQEAGKIITYLRRYAFAAVLGMYADEDTDANPAQNAPRTPQKPAKAKKPTNGGSMPQVLVDAGAAPDIPNAAGMLNLMPPELRNDTEKAVAWGKHYRAFRDEGLDTKDAALKADEKMGVTLITEK